MENEGIYKDGKKVKMKQGTKPNGDSKKVWQDEDEQEEDIQEVKRKPIAGESMYAGPDE